MGVTEIEKYKFQQHKSPISISHVDIDKILVFNKVSLSIYILYIFVSVCLLVT